MASIDDFKSNLIGGGARANQYRVILTAPPAITTGLEGVGFNRASYLVKATSLPGQTISEIEVQFRGRQLYVAGDRTVEAWTTTFINDTDFMVRNALERWSNGINDLALNTGVIDPADYQTDLTVEQLDRDDTILKTYIFRSAWPVSITAIELTSEAADALEEFECTWRYQHFEASGVNF